jgi:hypothetical protein
MARYDIHVIPNGEQWAVIREGDDVSVSIHDSEAEAAVAGRQLAADGAVAFTSHGRDGTDDDFMNDSREPGQ